MNNPAFQTLDPDGPPIIERLSRRRFLQLTGAAASLAIPMAFAEPGAGKRGNAAPALPSGAIRLPDKPSQNPAFRAEALGDGGLLVWTYDRNKFRGYRFNAVARWVWRVCDGRKTGDELRALYAAVTRRPEAEFEPFLVRLREAGIIAQGGYVVPRGDFPRPGPGGSYNARIDKSEPLTSEKR
jgi:hypothetical protein